MSAESAEHYLAVDIGGTKTDVALFLSSDESFTPVVRKRYSSRRADGIEEIISDFLDEHRIRCELISIGIAGVVGEDSARVTNLPWTITKESMTNLGFSAVSMINDMTAVAASLPLLGEDDLYCLQRGAGTPGPIRAVLAPGTGLGEGFLLHSEQHYFPRGTEGGHTDFAPVNREQRELLEWLSASSGGIVSYEMVCAGPAISTLYDFYLARGATESSEIKKRLAGTEDRTPVIVAGAVSGSCPVCSRALDLFFKILGREGANLVMKLYATGGLYLGGGILPRMVGSVSLVPFLKAFHFPGPMASLLASAPIHVILRQDAALLGTACHGKRLFF